MRKGQRRHASLLLLRLRRDEDTYPLQQNATWRVYAFECVYDPGVDKCNSLRRRWNHQQTVSNRQVFLYATTAAGYGFIHCQVGLGRWCGL